MPLRLIRLMGRRGACLLVLGLIQLVIGWSIFAAPTPTLLLIKYIPQWVLAGTWIISAIVSFAGIRRGHSDAWGFIGAWQTPFIWGGMYLFEVLPPLSQLQVWAGIRTTAFLWGYAALVVVISGWPEGQIIVTGEGSSHDDSLGRDS